MAANKDYVGKTYRYRGDRTRVKSVVKRTRTKVNVRNIDRGEGWDDIHEEYVGVKKPHGWMRGENKEFGKDYEVHIKDLEDERGG